MPATFGLVHPLVREGRREAMAKDDRRMHEGYPKPGQDTKRDQQPSSDDAATTAAQQPEGDIANDIDRDQSSALGGDVATRSSTAPTPESERAS
jgi:hypothetical protein